jgi:hypothetical protein
MNNGDNPGEDLITDPFKVPRKPPPEECLIVFDKFYSELTPLFNRPLQVLVFSCVINKWLRYVYNSDDNKLAHKYREGDYVLLTTKQIMNETGIGKSTVTKTLQIALSFGLITRKNFPKLYTVGYKINHKRIQKLIDKQPKKQA